MANRVEKRWLCEYQFHGDRWSIEVWARTREEAAFRLQQIGKGFVVGELKASVPYGLGWFAKGYAAIANLLQSNKRNYN